ncbi:MAG: PAS domain S-box protein [Bacteroidetes bacterium]|nr:PAS domain S-box protein [Bacteroidota bacterium]MBU1115682.1 PAS domain S-box protein [Bacteroidota bacterium]MBU1798364.1 PAS domain S-box protein [Bacteroidota bacterium]
MKKKILDLLSGVHEIIVENWSAKLEFNFGNKLSKSEIKEFVNSSLRSLTEVIKSAEYLSIDQYLIDSYNLFSRANINLLEVSQIFSSGRFALLHNIDKTEIKKHDPIIILGFLDDIIEQIFARYSMLYQNTQIKEIEYDRDRLAKKLEMNQQYLNTILYKSDTAIAVIDINEKYVSWNHGAEAMFGYTEQEVVGQDSKLLLPNLPKYLDELEFIIKETQIRGEVQISDTKRKTKEGIIIPVQIKVTQIKNQNGINSGRTMIMQDLSQVKKLQQQVDQSEKLAVIGQLAAGVAHEIGNPLTSISALVQIMQRKNKDEKLTDQLGTIKDNIDRISKIVRELVDFSRPPGEDKELLQINDVVKIAVGIVKYDKRVKNVEFKTCFSKELPMILAVPDQLLQVYVNILINALDAINGEGKIEVRTYLDDVYICTDIEDDGYGMDNEVRSKIFNPFFTTKEVGKGTGLGLSVSYGIIKKMQGKILVKSEINAGSIFTVKLLP